MLKVNIYFTLIYNFEETEFFTVAYSAVLNIVKKKEVTHSNI